MPAHNEMKAVKAWFRRVPGKRMAAVVIGSVSASACLTFMNWQEREPEVVSRGIYFDHAFHADVGPMDCTICHQAATEGHADFTMPDHNLCSVCHDIPMDALALTEQSDVTGCAMCHTKPDYSVAAYERRLQPDVIWRHEPHLAAEVACAQCHVDPDRPHRRPDPGATLKQFCMNCHGAMQPYPEEVQRLLTADEQARDDAAHQALADEMPMPPPPEIRDMLDCSVCHLTLDKNTVPTQRAGRPLPHDKPAIWERIHGREYQADPQFCTQCHVSEEQCDTCHSQKAPSSHTLSWRRNTHGLHATWNRQSCAVCHEEDTCVKCHQNTTPRSHRSPTWDSPLNRHCMSCHFPPERTSCTVCHEEVQHRRAMPSPHTRGLYPANCAMCHPGGLPHRAPHPMNSTVRCTECHQ